MFEYAFLHSELAIRVIGRFGAAGKVEFTLAGQLVDAVQLPKGEWAVFAILAAAARGAPDHSIEAYISSKQLATRLRKRNIIEVDDPQIAIRAVARLRKRLGRLEIARLLFEIGVKENPDDFAKLLIERNHLFGYRINLSPDDLYLEILEMPG